ncbi:MAG: hypothetical protein M1820_005103 [Bogoriella megaspora]|nr:MAG: hypothetical protein M1820_005103 [Bogoriella megaspora]
MKFSRIILSCFASLATAATVSSLPPPDSVYYTSHEPGEPKWPYVDTNPPGHWSKTPTCWCQFGHKAGHVKRMYVYGKDWNPARLKAGEGLRGAAQSSCFTSAKLFYDELGQDSGWDFTATISLDLSGLIFHPKSCLEAAIAAAGGPENVVCEEDQ